MPKNNCRLLFSLLVLILSQSSLFAADSARIHLIPQPVSLSEKPGQFVLDQNTSLQADASLNETTRWFLSQVK